MRNEFKFYHPFGFVGRSVCGDVIEYGFRFDLTTECTIYTYDWGRGCTVRLLGFGFEYTRFGP
jgi:hypothetical protein